MKILHTSDWHVGKVLKGRDRHDKHVAVLRSIVQGDLFETAAPNPRAQGLVIQALLALREDGRQVVVIAGNHDNQLALRTRGGEAVKVAALPFLSHRHAVRPGVRRACPGLRAAGKPDHAAPFRGLRLGRVRH